MTASAPRQFSKRTVAIHQPNFFPWLGYFDKIARCDHFVVLDHVQFSRSWINRVKLLVAGEARWVTASVRHVSGTHSILETQFEDAVPWRRKFIATLESSYGKAPAFRGTMDLLEPLISNPTANVAEYNLASIRGIGEAVGLNVGKLRLSSELEWEGESNELLISLTKAVGGSAYFCGGGAGGYQQDDLFREAGLELEYQDFVHPRYPQHGHAGEFVTGLSIIDALMNLGPEGVGELLNRS